MTSPAPSPTPEGRPGLDLSPRMRSALTLAVLCVLLLVASAWGWSALTRPLPALEEEPACVDSKVAAGDTVVPDQVAVSVYNASNRNGLASKTLNLLVARGFGAADTGNAPQGTKVGNVQIWTDDPDNPAVQLVRKQFRKANVTEGPTPGLGVVVVVGNKFNGLKAKKKSAAAVEASAAATICSPTGAVTSDATIS